MNNIVLDFETTGIDVLQDLPVQAAIAVYGPSGKLLEDFVTYLNPKREISPGAMRCHHINDFQVQQEGKSLKWFCRYWHSLVWKYQPVTLIGYNLINFDQIMLQRILAKHSEGRFKFPPIEQVTDVLFLCCRHFQTRKWPRLIDAVNRLGIQHKKEDFHDALADVRYTWLVYNTLMARS